MRLRGVAKVALRYVRFPLRAGCGRERLPCGTGFGGVVGHLRLHVVHYDRDMA